MRLDTIQDIWNEYRSWAKFSTRVANVKLNDPNLWLLKTPSEAWFSLLSLCRQGSIIDTYELMFALGILAYRSDINSGLVRALLVAAMNFHSNQLQQVLRQLPAGNFDLSHGHTLSLKEMQSMAESCCFPYQSSPQSQLVKMNGESKNALKSRRVNAYNLKRTELCTSLAGLVFKLWPSSTVVWPNLNEYTLIDLPSFKKKVESTFATRFLNRSLFQHTERLQAVFHSIRSQQANPGLHLRMSESPSVIPPSPRYVHLTLSALMNSRNPPTLADLRKSPSGGRTTIDKTLSVTSESSNGLGLYSRTLLSTRDLLMRLHRGRENDFSSRYAQDLAECVDALEDQLSRNCGDNDTHCHLSPISPHNVEALLQPTDISERILRDAGHWPSLGPESLLCQLSFEMRREVCENWLQVLVLYAESLAAKQQQQRLSTFSRLGLEMEYAKEQENYGRHSWDGMVYPDWLLIQIDANIRIRPVQISIARQMMFPNGQSNTVMQLNMGEGKSSVCSAFRIRITLLCYS
jgi:hypothetical protein